MTEQQLNSLFSQFSAPQSSHLTEAIERFRQLLQRAQATSLREPTAASLATAGRDGRVTARVVLLRGMDRRGFVFYTNALSSKARQLAENPQAALCFHWDPLGEQVRVEGQVERVTDAEADEYWSARPRESQIGAWASLQSQPLDRRETLDQRVRQYAEQFSGQPVPRPAHWTGYRVVPSRIEFWTSRPARLHERTVYEQHGDSWQKFMLYP